jgi:hypothetical protein
MQIEAHPTAQLSAVLSLSPQVYSSWLFNKINIIIIAKESEEKMKI